MESKIDPSQLDGKFAQVSEKTWVVDLEEDPETGDLVMPIPLELLEAQGWAIGDTLEWDVQADGAIHLSKKK